MKRALLAILALGLGAAGVASAQPGNSEAYGNARTPVAKGVAPTFGAKTHARGFGVLVGRDGKVTESARRELLLPRYRNLALTASNGCVDVPEVSQTYVGPDGDVVTQPTPGYATLHHFADGGQQQELPAGFDPTTASDSALQVFGFPPRPTTAGPALSAWVKEWAGVTNAPIGEVRCAELFNSDIDTPTQAGIIDYYGEPGQSGPPFDFVGGDLTQPAVDNSFCTGKAQSHSWWVGIGDNGAGLMQVGTVRGSTSEHIGPFWEVVQSSPGIVDEPPPHVFPGTIAAGDLMHFYLHYDPTVNPGGSVSFTVHDATTGVYYQTGWLSTPADVDGQYPDFWYDGGQEAWIDERGQVEDGGVFVPTQLTKQIPADSSWTSLATDPGGHAPGTTDIDHFRMVSPAGHGIDLAQDYSGSSFNNTWSHCGTYGS